MFKMLNRFATYTQEKSAHRRPDLSVVVVIYDIPREAQRTLLSLSASYQRNIQDAEYEIIVVDNGSNPPIDPKLIRNLKGNFRLVRIEHASPAQAVNRGIAEGRGGIVGVLIDGARIVTPQLLHFARRGARLFDRAVVVTLGWYLGGDLQWQALTQGYDQAREDALLDSIEWPKDGYRLFEIATFDESSRNGWLQPIGKSNALFMRREMWEELGGLDERFDHLGGEFVNTDVFRRTMELPGVEPIFLLGEGTFQQFLGGIATDAPNERMERDNIRWRNQYQEIRGKQWSLPRPRAARTYLGTLPRPMLARFVHAAIEPHPHEEPPLGPDFDRSLWSIAPVKRPDDPIIAQLLDLAQSEFRAGRLESAAGVAHLIRGRAPDEAEAQRLLSLTAPRLPWNGAPHPWRVDYHLALARAYHLLEEHELEITNYRAALSLNGDLPDAHLGLANLRLPGDSYLTWLERLYTRLSPKTLIEIGVYQGGSLSLARPPTLAIGVDPQPLVLTPLKTETHIFVETSDAFFARRGPDSLLAGRPLGVGFIDGLHLYEQALKDFINLERYCGPRSVILLHDPIPLDEPTQARARNTVFHTGDVWKTMLCLKQYRPDLNISTIATAPTGLAIVTGLDPESRVLENKYEEAVARFVDTPYFEIEGQWEKALNVVPNNWDAVEERLRSCGIL